ncbi:MAG: RsfS/YbeB/iojap family protein, partial [Pseudomonadota bacterium]|nr:RsfS/YbeB/iojap family protein [Pseudomonadota bacterium]
AGVPILGKEGLAQADWILLDTAEVIVHLFRPEVRDFYSLERMWDTVTPRDDIVQVHAD